MGTEIGRQGNNYFCSVFKIIYLNDLIGGFCVGRHVAPLGHSILILSQPSGKYQFCSPWFVVTAAQAYNKTRMM
jgi:hypothetical protein